MQRHERLALLLKKARHYPLSIAHRGASGHCLENTMDAFAYAAQLQADMWELDVRFTKDGICVVCHDDNLQSVAGVDQRISDLTLAELNTIVLKNGETIPTFAAVVALAKETHCGLYVELKGAGTGAEVQFTLQQAQFDDACIGSFHRDWIKELDEQGCEYPLAVLVKERDCLFEQARLAGADIIHLCWEKAVPEPHTLVTPELIEQAQEEQWPIILWHEERKTEIESLLTLPVLGICSNLPEMLSGYYPHRCNPIDMVLHRGACCVAPENTLMSTELGLRSGAQVIELDLHASSDNKLMVIHDSTADRTTSLSEAVENITADQLATCDAGSWFHPRFSQQGVPHFHQLLTMVSAAGKDLYVELKVADVDQVMEEIQHYYALEHCFFWSFNAAYVDDIEARYPQARIMRRRLDYASLDALFIHCRPAIIEYDYQKDDLSEFTACRELGVKVMLRYPGKDLQTLQQLIALQPDMVNIDYPFAFAKAYRAWLQLEQVS